MEELLDVSCGSVFSCVALNIRGSAARFAVSEGVSLTAPVYAAIYTVNIASAAFILEKIARLIVRKVSPDTEGIYHTRKALARSGTIRENASRTG